MRRDGIYHSAFVLQKPNRKLLDYIRKWASTAKRFNSGKKGLTSRQLKFRWPNMPEQCTNLDSVKFNNFEKFKQPLEILTNHIAIAIENSKLYNEISFSR